MTTTIELGSDWTKQNMYRAVDRSYFDREDGRTWKVDDPTPKAAAVICRLLPELSEQYPELVALRDTLLVDSRPFDNATEFNTRIVAPNVEEALAREDKSFYDFQAIDLGYLHGVLQKHSAAEIAWERGLGKTLAACALIDATASDRVLVAAPNTAKISVWADEIARFLPAANVRVIPNAKGPREKMLDFVASDTAPGILIVHYEALSLVAKRRVGTKTVWDGWKRYGTWDLVVCDESHRLANPKTQMHRALKRIPTQMKLSLTGSMIMNHPEEIYGRLNWLFPKQYSSKWRDWNNRFLNYVDSGYGKVLIGPDPDRVEEMRRELGVFTVYRRKSDELDLPPKTEQTLRVDLGKQQRAAYDDLRDSYVATLDSGEQIVALQPVVLLTRLRQVATGLELLSGEVADSSKLDLAVEMVRDNPDDPFVVFSWYKAAAVALAERLRADGEVVHLVTGDTSHRNRTLAIKDFQAGHGRVFVGTISTLGESVNLHRATQAIFLDRSWNPASNEQAADRIYRIGQTRPVTITYIVARDTVDEYNVLPTLNNKQTLRRMILGGD